MKVLMQDFHYNSITNKYRDKTKILTTNTDSPMCKIEDENVYEVSNNTQKYPIPRRFKKLRWYK